MGDSAITASHRPARPAATLFPAKTHAAIWAMSGATMMNGLDDYPKRTEIDRASRDASSSCDFAKANGMSTLSMWAIQRDNGGCPGATGANDCSGIVQDTWDFSHLLSPFTG